MVAKDGCELDTDDEIEMHLVICPQPCAPSLTSGKKEEGRRSKDGPKGQKTDLNHKIGN